MVGPLYTLLLVTQISTPPTEQFPQRGSQIPPQQKQFPCSCDSKILAGFGGMSTGVLREETSKKRVR